MRRRCGALLVLAVLTGFATLSAAAAPVPPRWGDLAALRTQARALVAAGAPGVVVLVRHGDAQARIAEGRVSEWSASPVRASDRFRTGSVTKTFVAALVLRLVAEHRLGLHDTVARWLPGLLPEGGRITVLELLAQRSGLYDYTGDRRLMAPYRRGDLGYHWTPRQLVGLSVAHKPRFPPGRRFLYSNTGYVVLGLIVEAVTGKPLGVELRDLVFRPLHLEATSLGRGAPSLGRSAQGAMRIDGVLRDTRRIDLSADWASGGIVSKAADVADFYRALLSGRLLPPRLVRLMTVAGDPHRWYGLGVMKRMLACGLSFGHAGDTPGFVADVNDSLDGNVQSVTFANVDLGTLPRWGRRIFFRLSADAYCASGVPAGPAAVSP